MKVALGGPVLFASGSGESLEVRLSRFPRLKIPDPTRGQMPEVLDVAGSINLRGCCDVPSGETQLHVYPKPLYSSECTLPMQSVSLT